MHQVLIFVALFACIGGFLFGYDLGLIGGAWHEIQKDFNTSEREHALVVGAAKMGAVFGSFIGGASMHKFGRRATIAFDSVFFAVGPLIMAAAQSSVLLVIGRLCVGLGIGVSAVVVPVYLAEMAPPRVRGALVSTYEVMLCVGMIAAAAVDWALRDASHSWRWMVGLPVVPGLSLLAALLLLPESPRWLVMKGDLNAAMTALRLLCPGGTTSDVEDELLWLWSAVEKDRSAVKDLRSSAAAGAALSRGRPRGLELAGVDEIELSTGSPGSNGTSKGAGPDLDAGPAAATKHRGQYSQVAASAEPAESTALGAGGVFEPDANAEAAGNRIQDPCVKGHAAVRVGQSSEEGQEARDPPGATSADDLDTDSIALMGHMPSSSSPLALQAAAARWAAPASLAGSALRAEVGTGGSLESKFVEADSLGLVSAQTSQHDVNESFLRTLHHVVVDIAIVLRGDERRAVQLALVLAFFNQMMASTALINYAVTLFESLGVSESRVYAYNVVIPAVKMVGVLVGMALVDRAGRRTLLLLGSAGAGVGMAALAGGFAMHSVGMCLLAMCVYIFAISTSWAGVFWVICSELFSMSIKSPAMASAIAMLFLSGSIADLIFPYMLRWFGSGTFAIFSAVSFAALLYVWHWVPETKGKTLLQVQTLLRQPTRQPFAASISL